MTLNARSVELRHAEQLNAKEGSGQLPWEVQLTFKHGDIDPRDHEAAVYVRASHPGSAAIAAAKLVEIWWGGDQKINLEGPALIQGMSDNEYLSRWKRVSRFIADGKGEQVFRYGSAENPTAFAYTEGNKYGRVL